MEQYELQALLPEGWEAHPFGDMVTCPHGYEIELDGQCPDGCVSPLREMGLI